MHSEDAVSILAGMIMQNFIASEVGVYLDIHLQGGVYLICTPPIEQSDWLECYNHGTNNIVQPGDTMCVTVLTGLGRQHSLWVGTHTYSRHCQ